MPDRACCLAGVRGLMERDWANIRAGYYRMPQDLFERPDRLIGGAVRFFGEVPKVDLRRRRSADRVVVLRPPPGAGKLPGYYLQNFHFQSDGYLSDNSARLYDHQVEVLFGGGADAMRRQALVPIPHHFRRPDRRRAIVADLACGTGQFLTFLRDSQPGLRTLGIDLSLPYLAEARRRLAR